MTIKLQHFFTVVCNQTIGLYRSLLSDIRTYSLYLGYVVCSFEGTHYVYWVPLKYTVTVQFMFL